MSAALTLAIYALCCKQLGQVPVFPGNKFYYNAVDDFSYAPSLAEMNGWAASSEHTKNEAFNHTNGDVIVWRYFWPKVLNYFDIEVRLLYQEAPPRLFFYRYITANHCGAL